MQERKACVSEIETGQGPAAGQCFSTNIQARAAVRRGNRSVGDKRSLNYVMFAWGQNKMTPGEQKPRLLANLSRFRSMS
jgi:hypothetical protein